MAANNFKVFNESKTNVMNDTDYGIHIQRKDGVSSGLAVSSLHNKLYRQTSIAAKAVADFIASQELDATDNDSILFSTNLLKALGKVTKVPLEGHRTKEVLDHPDGSVTTPKIADRSVTTEKIAYNSVGTPELKTEVFNNHNADVKAHTPILNAIKAISGMSAYDIAPSKTIAEIITLLGFGGIVAQRLETNGYIKFANGFTIQWGNNYFGDIVNKQVRINFPISYKSIPSITMSPFNNNSANDYNIYINKVDSNGFIIHGSEWASVVQDISVYWISVGN